MHQQRRPQPVGKAVCLPVQGGARPRRQKRRRFGKGVRGLADAQRHREDYKLQDEGLDTVDANVRLGFGVDERDYGVGASIIREMGIKHMRLMTNNPLKRVGLEGYGLKIDEIVPIVIAPNKYNERYLETKQERMHHKLNLCKH